MKKPQLEDHLGRAGQLIETNVENAPVKDIKWEAQEMTSEASAPLADDGSGKEVILRRFQFSFPPNLPKKPTKKEILAFHKDRMNVFLWKDELELIQEPKIIIGKKGYDIFATCIAKKGSLIFTKPQLLQHAITKQPSTGA